MKKIQLSQKAVDRILNFLFIFLYLSMIVIALSLSSCNDKYVGIEHIKGSVLCSKTTVTNRPFSYITYFSPKTGKYYEARIASVMIYSINIGDTIK